MQYLMFLRIRTVLVLVHPWIMGQRITVANLRNLVEIVVQDCSAYGNADSRLVYDHSGSRIIPRRVYLAEEVQLKEQRCRSPSTEVAKS